ncbi:MAG TPA: hypothetical protein VN892_18275 [Solirubrobacteraceae bacterium]|nr:hypothetical protein [Solirubrobacteraceae bacterium]
MREVRIALVAGLALVGLAIGVELAHSPMTVARTNVTSSEEDRIARTVHGATYCQAGELLPRETTAIRLSLFAFTGPRIRVVVSSGGRPIASGQRASGWTSRVVTVAVRPLPQTVSDVTVCASFAMHDEALTVFGQPAPRASAAYEDHRALRGRMWIEYLRTGSRTWASLIPSIASAMGLGRAAPGTWNVLLVLVLLVTVVVLASRLVLKELS